MSSCEECGATHSDPCTYSLCPRRLKRKKNARQHGTNRLGFQRALDVFPFTHDGDNTYAAG